MIILMVKNILFYNFKGTISAGLLSASTILEVTDYDTYDTDTLYIVA